MKWNLFYQITAVSRTPEYGATAPRSLFSVSSVLNWICWTPTKKILVTPLHEIRLHYSRFKSFRKIQSYLDCTHISCFQHCHSYDGRLRLKCDGTRAEKPHFFFANKRTSPLKSAWGRQYGRLLADEVCASAVVMLDTPCSEVVWSVLATHCIRQFPLHFPFLASPCAITFQLDSTKYYCEWNNFVQIRRVVKFRLDVYHWGAGLGVTGRMCDVGQSVL